MGAGHERGVLGHEQPVDVEEGEGVHQHILGGPAPGLVEGADGGEEVSLSDACALGATCGARGVAEDPDSFEVGYPIQWMGCAPGDLGGDGVHWDLGRDPLGCP